MQSKYMKQCHEFIRQLYNSKSDHVSIEKYLVQFHQLQEATKIPLPALLYLKITLRLEETVYFMLMCAIIYEIDPQFCAYCTQKSGVPFLSYGMVLSLYQKITKITYEQVQVIMQYEWMRLLFEPMETAYVMRKKIQLRETVLFYCLSDQMKPMEGITIWQGSFIGENIYSEQYDALKKLVLKKRTAGLQGRKGSGRTCMMHRLCNELNMTCFMIEPTALQKFNDLLIYLLLQNSIAVLWCDPEIDWNHWIKRLEAYGIPIVLVGDTLNYAVPMLILDRLTQKDDLKLKAYYGIEANTYMGYHPLPADYIKNDKDIHSVVPLSFVQVSNRNDTFQDLILNEDMTDKIKHVLFMMTHPHMMNHCLSLLFYGSSGTGKTMCAHILAKEAGLPLWKINLSMILDKYIGESEKHLEKLFDAAQKENCILLFDEADVLFSKRTQISSANDRYANSSTAYLLQKLESYRGILILTTNHLHHFDDAFLRRIQFVMHFSAPTKQERLQKWKRSMGEFDCLYETDYEMLAELTDLTMASIDNIKWNAVIYWKQSQQGKMTKEHIQKALLQEYEKVQKRMPALWSL